MSKFFNSIEVSQKVSKMVNRSFFIVNQICDILDQQGRTSGDLASLLGVKLTEINLWMQGIHDFSDEELILIQEALGEKINFNLPE